MTGKRSISYWYKKGDRWCHFIGLYEDNVIVGTYLDSIEVNPTVLWIMDEPFPMADLTIWEVILTAQQMDVIHDREADLMDLPFSNHLTHWYRL